MKRYQAKKMRNRIMQIKEWVLCSACGNKTCNRIRVDTVLIKYPLFFPKCKQQMLDSVGQS